MRDIPWFRILGLALLGAAITAIVLIVRGAGSLPDDVQPVAWHEQPCAHCQMLVGEPAHAAQLITTNGDVLAFDDPGCALRYIEERQPAIHRLWFHHATHDHWIPSDRVAFERGGPTPMGSGLHAVEVGAPGALDLTAAHMELKP